MDEAKIYNVCLQRVKFQITNAKQRLNNSIPKHGRVVLESYQTGDMDEIIDILELYDLDSHTPEGLAVKLEDLAYTVSLLVKEEISFEYDDRGNLCLCLRVQQEKEETFDEAAMALAEAS